MIRRRNSSVLPIVVVAAAVVGGSAPFRADVKAGIAAYEAGDYETALREWQASAEQGQVEALFNIGLLHYHGRGVSEDRALALDWYRRAAERGYARAQYTIAEMYETGDGVPKDLIQAHLWFKLAGSERYADARKRKKRVAKKMDEHQIALAEMHAREWKRKLEK